ncbi:hypothetical protein AB0M64_32610 [Streptomyces sp. NPDC051771]|uniref:hypothetical protein n=1 Tax=Streptomyces sp. NPDC051771 TaxID=3154847 RepID=UPI00341532A4
MDRAGAGNSSATLWCRRKGDDAAAGQTGRSAWRVARAGVESGGFGATAPFALHGESSAEARARPAERVPVGDREVTELDPLVEIFEAQGVSVILR